ncbi:MAG: NAD(P)-binding domain-containing protein [Tepidanaerobacteraceae bacterium]|jgi:pyrroline-5-carboxylate reductase|nr:NAD(P)-binding domain-containing protein [Tepidanaerobacteraceae bacterium]
METITIIGTGRMGSLLAKKFSGKYKLILIDRDLRRCGLLASKLGVESTSEYSLIPDVDFIIVALPAAAIPKFVNEVKPFLRKDHILINISTDTPLEAFNSLSGCCKLVSAKIVGHAIQIDSGELPLILIDGGDGDARKKTAQIFGNLGPVKFGPEKIVKEINRIASEEGIKAAYNIQNRLKQLDIPEEYFGFAVRNVACGTMNAYAIGDAGPFAMEIIAKLEENQN